MEARGQGLGIQGGQDTSRPLWGAARGADKMESSKDCRHSSQKRELSSWGTERGSVEEAHLSQAVAIRAWGGGGGGRAHQAWGEHKQQWPSWPWSGALEGGVGRGDVGPSRRVLGFSRTGPSPHPPPQVSSVPVPPRPSPRGRAAGAHHADDVWVDRLNEDSPRAPHTLHQLIERRTLHLLPLQVGHTVQEVKHHPALGQLPAQQLVQLRGRHVWEGGRG